MTRNSPPNRPPRRINLKHKLRDAYHRRTVQSNQPTPRNGCRIRLERVERSEARRAAPASPSVVGALKGQRLLARWVVDADGDFAVEQIVEQLADHFAPPTSGEQGRFGGAGAR